MSIKKSFIIFLNEEFNPFAVMSDCNTKDYFTNIRNYKKNYEKKEILLNSIFNWLAIFIYFMTMLNHYEKVLPSFILAIMGIIVTFSFTACIVFFASYILMSSRKPYGYIK